MNNFEMPKMNVTLFGEEDVITTSGDNVFINSDGSVDLGGAIDRF